MRPNTTPEYPGHLPAKKKKRRWVQPAAFTATALLGIGIGAATAGGTTETVSHSTTPAPTQTVTAEPITETVTEEVEVTPQACLDYITHSEEAFGYAATAMEVSMEVINAVVDYDVAGVEQGVADMESLNADLESVTPPMLAAKEECRGANA